ncbi:Oxidoreductase ptaJ [Paramyrothecium foliicola]|nr:Oxidoreductase ptaJ [Paramyrothecium foliicola]
MSTATKISISAENTELWGIEQSKAAQEFTELLQLDVCTRLTDRDKVTDGIVVRAKLAMLKLLEQFHVPVRDAQERMAEMFCANTYVESGAAIRPSYHAEYDFFLMHQIDSAPLYSTISNAVWIDGKKEAHMLEWKHRMDLVQYVARGCSLVPS